MATPGQPNQGQGAAHAAAAAAGAAAANAQQATGRIAAGLDRLKGQWLDFAGELVEPMAILAAGGTKTAAVWAGLKGVFLSKVLGPLGMVVGMATSFLVVSRKLVSEWRQVGVQSAKAVETLTNQFKPLLGSLDLAKKRAREVFAFTVKSPFRFQEVAEGNKVLQSLSKGALAGERGMTLVGDAAAVAGEGFLSVATYVGRMYDGLMSGRPVGEAAMRLQEMGLISGATRNQIENLQAANADGLEIWKLVEQEIRKTKGAMDVLSESLEGLESTYEDTRQQMEAGFGAGFLEGEKAGVKAATQVMERLTPVARELGEELGSVSNWFARMRAKAVDVATSLPGFSTVVGVAARAVVALSLAVAAAAGGMFARFLAGAASAALGAKQMAAAGATASAAARMMTLAQGSLAGALKSVAAGQVVATLAHVRAAAVQMVAAVRTNALTAAQVALRGVLVLTSRAVVFLARQIALMGAALARNPMFLAAAAFVAAAAAAVSYANSQRKAREEAEAFDRTTRATAANLERMRRNVTDVTSLRQAEAAALGEVSQAYVELWRAQQGGNVSVKQAEERLGVAKKGLAGIRAIPREALDRSDAQQARDQQQYEGRRDVRRMRGDFDAGRGEEAELVAARDAYNRRLQEQDAANDGLAREAALEDERQRLQREVNDKVARREELLARRAQLEEKIRDYDGADASTPDFGLNQLLSRPSRAGLDAVNRQLAELDSAEVDGRAAGNAMGLESDSEITRLKARVAIYDELKAAADSLAEAAGRVAELEGSGTEDEKAKLELQKARVAELAAESRQRIALAQAERAGVGADFSRQAALTGIGRMEGERTEALDLRKTEEARQRFIQADLEAAMRRAEVEAEISGVRLRGYEREEALLGIERRRLQIAMERGRIDADSFEQQRRILDAQEDAARRNAGEKGREMGDALRLSALQRREAEARRNGDAAKADELRKRAAALEDEVIRRAAKREAEEATPDKAEQDRYAGAAVEEARRQRANQQARDDEERSQERAGTRAGRAGEAAGLQARLEKLRGNSREAWRVREQAARQQDEVDRKDKRRTYRERGFSGAEADRMAAEDVKRTQAQRVIDEMAGVRGSVVASSLAQVGGGGNVAGSDPAVRLQERMVELLKQVADHTKTDVNAEPW